MTQLTLRVPEDLLGPLRAAAQSAGKSVNAWATAVLAAAVDPDLAGDEATAVRERLRRAGLLMPLTETDHPRPPADQVARARANAGQGRPLSGFVSEGRG